MSPLQPATQRAHRIIGLTARRVRKEPQLELILRVSSNHRVLSIAANGAHKMTWFWIQKPRSYA
jgi:hypothetical protein